MNYSELEDDEDLYEGLEAENLDSYEKKVEEKKKEIEKAVKPKEQIYEKSRNNLYKKLSGTKTIYTKKESCLFFGAPQASEDIEIGDHKLEFLLLINLLYFINDILIKNVCEKIGKVKRVLILEDEQYCKSLGMCLVEFYYLDNSQNYSAYLKEKLKVEVKKLDFNLEEQIKKDEIYNYGGYLDNSIVEQIIKENLDNSQSKENFNDIINKSLNLNKHPLFTWFNTNLKDVLNKYVKSEIKKKKKCSISNDYIDRQSESNSDSGSDISTHILNYVSKKNKFCNFNKT
ncbi:conserved Plasmodium protein, unknown function [Plasmodium gallinaceum]|uniref:RRM domain-containing protein n=1 Tax=Plasmodium gallinaceum TaxID=5849 RepID=A0A1J1H207_PLAGA|nr:conserved Plasmodium protein, unknown function [Plasmodium gallinaceum]CRG97563.1 conserved Plasmodium protein, unknown function [Plasmodium gallinaceum]